MKIKFEGLDGAGDNAGTGIPNGYAGMSWTNFSALDPAGSIFVPSGLNNGIISSTSVGYNEFGDPATFATQGEDFDLRKVWVTSAWNNGMTVTVDAWDDGVHVARKTFVVDYDGPTKAKFSTKFASVDTVTISASGGTDADAGDAGAGTHLAIEDLIVRFDDVVPTRVDDRHADAGHDALAALDATGFSHWLLS